MSGRFVLVGGARGWYVARPGSAKSYTPSLQCARVFASREEAEGHACGNEYVVSLDTIIGER